MRRVAQSDAKPIRLTAKLRSRLKLWLTREHKDALAGRTGIETTWRTALRMYQGIPASNSWLPFEGAPRIEVPIGAWVCDTIAAQAADLIFQIKPPLSLRSRKDKFDEHAAALQELVDWGIESKEGFHWRRALKEGILDWVQLGTVIWYVPWTERVRKTDLNKITHFGPRIQVVAPEHFILPGTATKNIQEAPWCTMRVPMGVHEARLAATLQGWKLDDEDSVSTDYNKIENDRRNLAGISTDGPDKGKLAIGYTWAYFDVDDDGIDEDIQIIWNMVSGEPLKVFYDTTDSRPFVMECYQDRAHVAYGIGGMEMEASFEEEITEIHNNRIWNMMLRNTQMYQGPEAAMGEVSEIYPGKYIPNDAGDIAPLPMGTADNAPIQAEAQTMSLAQQRVGVNELGALSRMGGRTPGITALSALQQANRRFTLPFDNLRMGSADTVMHALYRIQEQVRGGKDKAAVLEWLNELLGDKAQLAVELFESADSLADAIDVQLTASSVSINREADRQNMVMLTGIWEKYIQGMAMFAQAKAQPPYPGAEKAAEQAATALNKIMTKVLRTFDQVTDVEQFLVTLDDVQAGQPMPPELAAMMGQGAQNGAAPQGGPMQ